jgi:apolipoprotein N-acyltransferase
VIGGRLVHGIVLAWGWRRASIALLAGVASALAMAPFNAWPVLFLTFPVLVFLIDGAGGGRAGGIPAAALSGWWFGFGYFLAGLYWIGYAFLVDAQTFGWLLPIAVAGLPAGLALFFAAGFALARAMWRADSRRIFALAAALTVSEWLRGHILTGFPWNAIGYALATPNALAQIASWIGLWGLTFIAIAIFASPATLFDDRNIVRRPWLPVTLAVVTLIAMGGYGAVRLQRAPTQFVSDVRLRIMQPNLSQDVKFNYGAKNEVMQKYVTLSDRAAGPQASGVRDVTLLIWPESAFPFFLTREPDALAQISNLLPRGTLLITGGVRPPDAAPPGVPLTRAYNSIYVVDHNGTIQSAYDKLHLVPFGEYLPFQSTLESFGLSQLTKIRGGFIAGTRRRPITLPNAPKMLPLICYEIIFPGDITRGEERPGWIVNVTNDGWFGISTGPFQHLQQARLRAVEEGLPIVRAANTGISAVIDPVGRVVTSLGLGAEGVLDSGLPVAGPATFYSRYGDLPVAALIGLAIVAALTRRRTQST